MSKFYGEIGFALSAEVKPGVWKKQITKRLYRGELLRQNRSLQNAAQVNDDIGISNEISIVADPYANEHYYAMTYVEFRGIKWKVSRVEVQYPRLILSTGGLYNGPTV